MTKEKEQVALGSMVASALLTIAKAVVGFTTGSLAILSEAAHSLLDLVATIMTYFAVRISGRPADDEHHYGHGKVESVTALIATALLFILSGVVFWEAGQRVIGGAEHAVEVTFAAFGVMVASVIVDFFRARVLYRVAGETSSEALEADALHFGSDMWSSLAVLVGLGGVAVGFPWADSAAAVIVAVFICVAGWRLGRRTVMTLTDTAPEGVAERVTATALKIKRVVGVERVRVRSVGASIFVDLSVTVSRTLPLDRVASLRGEIIDAVRAQVPGAEIDVNVTPCALDDETVLERIMVIARNRGLATHHVTVHHIGSRLAVSLDLEVDGRLSIGAAHDIASGLEAAINDELGPEVEVETHIEPLQTQDLGGRDAPPERIAAVHRELSALAANLGSTKDIHDVRVRATPEGEIVNFHCHVDADLTVHDVHERIDDLERAVRSRFPQIKRVIGHAEPARPLTS